MATKIKLNPVTNYLKNVTKSMAYASADIGKELMPDVGEFASANKDFIKATYSTLKNPAMALRKSVSIIQKSKIYQAIEYGAKNTVEDLLTGNFYNKEREARDELKLAGMGLDDMNDFSEFGIDDNWEEELDKPSRKKEVTDGDLKIIDAVEGSSAANASATVNAIVKTSDYQAKLNKANFGQIYMQNERLFGGLHKDLSVVGATVDSIQKITSQSLQNIDKNMSDFFNSQAKLSQERNAMLKEILEMQRNMYKSASDRQKEENDKLNSKKKRNRWSDVQSGGIVDINSYFEVVKKNFSNAVASLGIPSLGGEDSNMLATFMMSPLKETTQAIIRHIIPSTVKAATKEFNDMLTGIFGHGIARLANAKASDEKGLIGIIAKFLGINTSVNYSIDTSRYEKGPIPFDGITRKAIIDVIPSYLRRIESHLTARPEQAFNYTTGSWMQLHSVAQELKDIKKRVTTSATSDIRELMKPAFEALGSANANTLKEFKEAQEEFYQYLTDRNGIFNPRASAEKNNVSAANYGNFYKYYDQIAKLYLEAGNTKVVDKNGKESTVYRGYDKKIGISNKSFDAKDSAERTMRSKEQDAENTHFQQYYASIGIDTNGKWNEKENKFELNAGGLLGAKDKEGNTVFDYLKNINTEMLWWRESAFEDIYNNLVGINMAQRNNNGGGRGRRRRRNNTPSNDLTLTEYITQNRRGRSFSDIANSNELENNEHRKEREKRKETIDNVNKKDVEKFVKMVNENKAIPIDEFDFEDKKSKEEFEKYLIALLEESYSTKYKAELSAYDESTLKALSSIGIYSYADYREYQKKKEKEAEKEEKEKEEETKDGFLNKVINGIKNGAGIGGGIVNATGEVVANMLRSANKTIYEMMYKEEIDDEEEDEDGNKKKKTYEGFVDMIQDKIKTTFNNTKTFFKDQIVAPFKKWLGIEEEDSIFGKFTTEIKKLGKDVVSEFIDSNKDTWGELFNTAKDAIGIGGVQNLAEKNRADNRKSVLNDIDAITSATGFYDPRVISLMRQYGLNPVHYNNFQDVVKDIKKKAMASYLKQTNNLTEATNIDEYDKGFEFLSTSSSESIKEIAKNLGISEEDINTLSNDALIEKIKKAAMAKQYERATKDENNGIENITKLFSSRNLNDERRTQDIDLLANTAADFIRKNNTGDNKGQLIIDTENKIFNTAISEASKSEINEEDRKNIRNLINAPKSINTNNGIKYYADKYGFSGDITRKRSALLSLDANFTEDELKEFDEDNLNYLYLNKLAKIHGFAKGSYSSPWVSGTMALSRGEKIIGRDGTVNTIGKTGIYNTGSNKYMVARSSNTGTTVRGDSDRERVAGKKLGYNVISGHADGTYNNDQELDTRTIDEKLNQITVNGNKLNSEMILKESKKYIGEGAAGGVVGGLLFGALGLPLIGIAAGAGASIVRKSDTLSNALFGKKTEDGERDNTGAIKKETVDAVRRYYPDMLKFGMAGIVPGLITGLGPIPGLLIGSTIGFIKNNERFTNKYFGESGKFSIKSQEKQILQDMLPGAAKGALAGIAGNILLLPKLFPALAMGNSLGGIGLVGSILLGSAVGMAASTQDFKDAVLGIENKDGTRDGGLLGAIKDSFAPIAEAGQELKDKLLNTLEKNVLDPLSQFAQPFIHELPRIAMWLPQKINDIIENHFGRSLSGMFKDVIGDPVASAVSKIAMPLLGTVANVVTKPVKLLGAVGKGIRKKQIREHRADYMTASERVDWAIKNGMGTNTYDRALAAMGSGIDGTLSTDQGKELLESLHMLRDSENSLAVSKKKTYNDINNILDSADKEGRLSRDDRKKIREALESGNLERAKMIISNGGFTESQMKSMFSHDGFDLDAKFKDYANIAERQKNYTKLSKQDNEKLINGPLANTLKKMGIDVDLTNTKEVDKLIANLNTEIIDREANGDKNQLDPVEQVNVTAEEINNNITDFKTLIIDILTGNLTKDEISERRGGYQKKINDANEKIDEIVNKEKNSYYDKAGRAVYDDWERSEREKQGENFKELSYEEKQRKYRELGMMQYHEYDYDAEGNVRFKQDENGNYIYQNDESKNIVDRATEGKKKTDIISKIARGAGGVVNFAGDALYSFGWAGAGAVEKTLGTAANILSDILLQGVGNIVERLSDSDAMADLGRAMQHANEKVHEVTANVDKTYMSTAQNLHDRIFGYNGSDPDRPHQQSGINRLLDKGGDFNIRETEDLQNRKIHIEDTLGESGRSLIAAQNDDETSKYSVQIIEDRILNLMYIGYLLENLETMEFVLSLSNENFNKIFSFLGQRRVQQFCLVSIDNMGNVERYFTLSLDNIKYLEKNINIFKDFYACMGFCLGHKLDSNRRYISDFDNSFEKAYNHYLESKKKNEAQNDVDKATNSQSNNSNDDKESSDSSSSQDKSQNDIDKATGKDSDNENKDESDKNNKDDKKESSRPRNIIDALNQRTDVVDTVSDTTKKINNNIISFFKTIINYIKTGKMQDQDFEDETESNNTNNNSDETPAKDNNETESNNTNNNSDETPAKDNNKTESNNNDEINDNNEKASKHKRGKKQRRKKKQEKRKQQEKAEDVINEATNNNTTDNDSSDTLPIPGNAKGTIPGYGVGSLILGTLADIGIGAVKTVGKLGLEAGKAIVSTGFDLAKGAVKGIWNAGKGLVKGAANAVTAPVRGVVNGAKNIAGGIGEAAGKVKGGITGTFAQIGDRFGKLKKGSDGSIEFDRTDAETDAALDEQEKQQKTAEKAAESQIKTQETINKLTAEPTKKNPGLLGNILKLVTKAAIILPFIKPLFENVLKPLWDNIGKPLWDNYIKPGIECVWNDIVVPAWNDHIKPFVEKSVLPTIEGFIGNLMSNLPTIIFNGITKSNHVTKYDDPESSFTEEEKEKAKNGEYTDEMNKKSTLTAAVNGAKIESENGGVGLQHYVDSYNNAQDIKNAKSKKEAKENKILNAYNFGNNVKDITDGINNNGALDGGGDNWNGRKAKKITTDDTESYIRYAVINNNSEINDTSGILTRDTKEGYLADIKTNLEHLALDSTNSKNVDTVSVSIMKALLKGASIHELNESIENILTETNNSDLLYQFNYNIGNFIKEYIRYHKDDTFVKNFLKDYLPKVIQDDEDEYDEQIGSFYNSIEEFKEYAAKGSNGIKPLSRYGRYKEETIVQQPSIDYSSLYTNSQVLLPSENITNSSLQSTYNLIEKARQGKISIFSSNYWNTFNDNDIANAYNTAMKVIAIPSIIVRNALNNLNSTASKTVTGTNTLNNTYQSIQNVKNNDTTNTIISGMNTSGTILSGLGKYGRSKYSKQIDPSIANIRFNANGDSEYQTIGDSGCGPAAAANAIESMYGRSSTLLNAANFALKGGYKERNGGTRPEFFSNYFASKGYGSQTTTNRSTLINNIKAGIPTVLMGQDKHGVSDSTPYGRNPHYVTATGIDSNGRVIIQDPESRYDNQLYSMSDVMKKTSFGVSAFGRSKYGNGTYDTDDNALQEWWYLRNKIGMSEAGAAGVLGNFNQESGLRPNNVGDDTEDVQGWDDEKFTQMVNDGTISKHDFATAKYGWYDVFGYGLPQWTTEDKKSLLYERTVEKGKSISDLVSQLDLLNYEITESDHSRFDDLLQLLRTTDNPTTAAIEFEDVYERSGQNSLDERISFANDIYDELKGKTGKEVTGSTYIGNISTTSNSSSSNNSATNTFSGIFGTISDILNNSKYGQIYKLLFGMTGSSSSSSTAITGTANVNTSSTLNTSGSAEAVITNALGEIGYVADPEGTKHNKYNAWFNSGAYDGEEKGLAPKDAEAYDWCANFVSWIMRHSGVDKSIINNSGSAYPKDFGLPSSNTVSLTNTLPGDVFFNGDGHVGIIAGYKNGTLYTVEGNGRYDGGNYDGATVDFKKYKSTNNAYQYYRPSYATTGNNLSVDSIIEVGDKYEKERTAGHGSNGSKPISKYGRFKESLNDKKSHKEINNNLKRMRKNEYAHLQLMRKESVYGRGNTDSGINNNLINTIINILYTIADNTDKLNIIVSILNTKLGTKITANDVNNTTSTSTLKQKLMSSLNDYNSITSISKINNHSADEEVDTIIKAMNAIASE